MSDNSDSATTPPLTWPLAKRPTIVSERVGKSNSRPRGESTIKVAIVDPTSFTRDCIIASVRNSGQRLPQAAEVQVEGFSSCDEVSHSAGRFDVIVYHCDHAHGEIGPDLSKISALSAVIVLSSDDRPEAVRSAFDRGIRGYIPTASTGLELLMGILRFVAAGGSFVPPSILASSEPLHTDGDRRLTRREQLIVDLLKRGKQNKVIAYELGLSESTVKVHIRNILAKLHAKNRTEAVSATMQMEGNSALKL